MLTALSSILQKVTHDTLNHHLRINNVLATEKSGFQKGIPSENVAYKLTDSAFKSLKQVEAFSVILPMLLTR